PHAEPRSRPEGRRAGAIDRRDPHPDPDAAFNGGRRSLCQLHRRGCRQFPRRPAQYRDRRPAFSTCAVLHAWRCADGRTGNFDQATWPDDHGKSIKERHTPPITKKLSAFVGGELFFIFCRYFDKKTILIARIISIL